MKGYFEKTNSGVHIFLEEDGYEGDEGLSSYWRC